VGSGVATCPVAPNHASLFGRAPALPRVPQLRTTPRIGSGLQCHRVSHGSEPHPSVQEGFDADIRLMTLYGLWAVRIKKGLAATGIQRGSHVIEVCLCVTEALARRADSRRYHYLQNMQAGDNSVVLQCNAARLTAPWCNWYGL
jgi:hypothetical protein